MASTLSTKEALMSLPPKAYFVVVVNGKETLYDASDVLAALDSVGAIKKVSDSALKATQTELDKRKQELSTHLADKSLHAQPTAKDLGLDALVNQSVAKGVDTQDPGLLRSSDLAVYLESEGYIKCTAKSLRSLVGGKGAGKLAGNADESVILGHFAGAGTIESFKNFVALGARSQPISDNSVVIGNTQQQVHTAMPVAIRADSRDFQSKPLDLGLDFVLKLNPMRSRMDLREDYIDWEGFPEPPAALEPGPCRPNVTPQDIGFRQIWADYQAQLKPWLAKSAAYEKAKKEWAIAYDGWLKKNRISLMRGDGSKARTQEQLTLLVQDLRKAANAVGAKFPGIVDQAIHGGLDIKAYRPDEMVPVLVKAVKDLHEYIHSDAFLDKLASRLKEK